VFLVWGLGGVNALGAEGEDKAGVLDAVDFSPICVRPAMVAAVPIGRDVCGDWGRDDRDQTRPIQAKLLGRLNVTAGHRPRAGPMNAQRV